MQGRKIIQSSQLLLSLPPQIQTGFEIILNNAEAKYTAKRQLRSELKCKKIEEKKTKKQRSIEIQTQLNALESELQEQKNANADLQLQLEQNRKANEEQAVRLAEKESELAISIINELKCHETIIYLGILNAQQEEELVKLKQALIETQKTQVSPQQLSDRRLISEDQSSDVRKISLVGQSIFQGNKNHSLSILPTEVSHPLSTEFVKDDHLVAQELSEPASPTLK